MSKGIVLGVIGAEGLVGSVVTKILKDTGDFSIVAPSFSELDIKKEDDVESWVRKVHPNALILLAAYTDVDGAQKKEGREEAMAINVGGTENVAKAVGKEGGFLIYISTDFVFPGTPEYPGPYSTGDERADPHSKEIGEYARSKLLGEIVVEKVIKKHAIVRIAFPFGNPTNPRDFARKTLEYIKKGYPLFSDQQFTPTYIPDLALAFAKIVKEQKQGIYHVVCFPPTSPFEFGQYLAKKMGVEGEIKEGSLREFIKGKTPRSVIGGLKPSKELFNRDWREALDEFTSVLKDRA